MLDFTSQALVGPHQLRCAPLDPLVELGERSLQVVFGDTTLGDVLECSEHTNHLTREVTQGNLVGLDPPNFARRAT